MSLAASSNITPSQDVCNKLFQFFCNKISSIYSNFDSQMDPFTIATQLPITHDERTLTSWPAGTTVKMVATMKTIHSGGGTPSDPYPHQAFTTELLPISEALTTNLKCLHRHSRTPTNMQPSCMPLLRKPSPDPPTLLTTDPSPSYLTRHGF